MRFAFALLAAAVCLHGQSDIGVDPFTDRFKSLRIDKLSLQVPHIHIYPRQCQSAPDGVYARSSDTYYACVKGKNVCSQEKGTIPRGMIEAYDARISAHNERMRDYRAAVKQRLGRTAPRTIETSALAAPSRAGNSSARPPVADEQVSGIATGTPVDEVVALLGAPHSRITGDFERLGYRLASGGSARLEFESGRLTRLQIVPASR